MRIAILLSASLVGALLVVGTTDAEAQHKKSWRLIECKTPKCVDAKKQIHGRLLLRWPNGSKRAEGTFHQGKRHGKWTTFWPNGQKLAELTYVAGTLSGPAKFWYESGKQRAVGQFAKGSRSGLWSIWGTEGTVIVKASLAGASVSFPKATSPEIQAAAKTALPALLAPTDPGKLISRAEQLAKSSEALRALASKPAPTGLSKKHRAEYDQQTIWLKEVADRFSLAAGTALTIAGTKAPSSPKAKLVAFQHAGAWRAAFDGIDGEAFDGIDGEAFGGSVSGAGLGMVSEMTAMNAQLLELQTAVQNESRRYQTLSNASRARLDIAMSAIRNTKD